MTAEEFKLRRAIMRCTQAELAKILRCNVRTIKRYEAHGCSGTVEVMMKALSVRRLPIISGPRVGQFPPHGLRSP